PRRGRRHRQPPGRRDPRARRGRGGRGGRGRGCRGRGGSGRGCQRGRRRRCGLRGRRRGLMLRRRGGAAERRGTPADLLVVGLANPGADYEGTRHNVGAEVIHLLAARHGATLRRSKERALADEVVVGGKRMALAIPLTYMNLSGEAVAPLVRRYGITDPERLVIVHDELD